VGEISDIDLELNNFKAIITTRIVSLIVFFVNLVGLHFHHVQLLISIRGRIVSLIKYTMRIVSLIKYTMVFILFAIDFLDFKFIKIRF